MHKINKTALCLSLLALSAASLALATSAGATYPWPLAPMDIQHNVSATFCECRQDRDHFHDAIDIPLGYGGAGLHGSNVKSKGPDKYYPELPDARPEIFLALDCDVRFLPGEGKLWSYLKTQLNWLHFPAPAVRLYPRWRFYLLYM